jgi:hypothetical protein
MTAKNVFLKELMRRKGVTYRVARWFVFKPKIPIWEKFGGPSIGKCLYTLWPFVIFHGCSGYFMTFG